MTAVAAACVGLAAVVVAWPGVGRRARLRRILSLATGAAAVAAPPTAALAVAAPPSAAPVADASGTSSSPSVTRRPNWQASRTGAAEGRLSAAAVVAAAVLGTLLGGPVAGTVVAAYGIVAGKLAVHRRVERARAARRVEWLDLLAAAAADLRAGLPAGTALAGLGDDATGGDPLRSRVEAAAVLADRTGAPLADVLERIEADARGAERARAAAAAQTAGARATAWLLAGLPAGGIGLGYALGTDPLAVLLGTPVGAVCAGAAVALQLAGLAWTGRIIHGATAVGQ